MDNKAIEAAKIEDAAADVEVYEMGIHEKLMFIQSRLKCSKDRTVKNYNGSTQYLYRNLAQIMENVKPLLVEFRCTLVVSNELIVVGEHITPVFDEEKNKNGDIVRHMIAGPHFYVKATATLTNADNTKESVSATDFAREAEYRKGMDPSQQTGSTSSYAGKYACERLFALDSSKDADELAAERNPQTASPF